MYASSISFLTLSRHSSVRRFVPPPCSSAPLRRRAASLPKPATAGRAWPTTAFLSTSPRHPPAAGRAPSLRASLLCPRHGASSPQRASLFHQADRRGLCRACPTACHSSDPHELAAVARSRHFSTTAPLRAKLGQPRTATAATSVQPKLAVLR